MPQPMVIAFVALVAADGSTTVRIDGAEWALRDGPPAGIPAFEIDGWRVAEGGASVRRDGVLVPGRWMTAWADCDLERPGANFRAFEWHNPPAMDGPMPAIELGTTRTALLSIDACSMGDGKVPMLMFDYRTTRANAGRH